MSYTRYFRFDADVVHIVANALPDVWGAACDPGASMPRAHSEPRLRFAKDNGFPTCVRCIVADVAWWRRNSR
jgi:hypothetical protein